MDGLVKESLLHRENCVFGNASEHDVFHYRQCTRSSIFLILTTNAIDYQSMISFWIGIQVFLKLQPIGNWQNWHFASETAGLIEQHDLSGKTTYGCRDIERRKASTRSSKNLEFVMLIISFFKGLCSSLDIISQGFRFLSFWSGIFVAWYLG